MGEIQTERQREKVHFSFAVPSGEHNNNGGSRERQYGLFHVYTRRDFVFDFCVTIIVCDTTHGVRSPDRTGYIYR